MLVVDDEESLRQFLELVLLEQGYAVSTAEGYESARAQLAESTFDAVLCDINMPDGNGIDLLAEIKKEHEERTAVIMMTAYTSTESAVEAMKRGAYDYVSKPFEVEELKVLVQKAIEKTRLWEENAYLKRELNERYTFSNIIGRSGRMQSIFRLIERVAKTPSTVLILGESGTGKELIAKAIHFNSARADRRFLSINCGALTESLLESELFGHERGAFTGAVKEKSGLFQEANGGTLFLDEIGEMTTSMQVRLLRALQERLVRKVGSTREESVDVRIIAATNRELESRIREGTFREDLYYRINVIPIHLPPLRNRREDIPLLVDHFVVKYSQAIGREPVRFSLDAMRILESHDWPGNVRELENIVERTLALCSEEIVHANDLPTSFSAKSADTDRVELPAEGLDLEKYLDGVRTLLMGEALERCGGVQTQAAELLGMTFRSFRYYAQKAGLRGNRDDDKSGGDFDNPADERG